MSGNKGMFSIASNVLASGGVIAIFPEGISHNEPEIQEVKTGAGKNL